MADDATIQALVDGADPGETVVLPFDTYELAGDIDIDKGLTLDFNGSTILFKDDVPEVRKGFVVKSTTVADRVIFKNGILLGDDSGDLWRTHLGPVVTSESGVQLGLFQIDSCVFQNLTFGCNFNCINGGFIGNAVLSNCLFDNIVQNPSATNDNDPERGKGAAFSLRLDKGAAVVSGVSYANVFKDCERHSLYVSSGGPFVSQGDSFFNNCKDLEPPFPIAAVSLAREGKMRMSGAYFENCRHGIALTTDVAGARFADVSISDCTFVESKVVDVHLNSGAPETVGVVSNVVVSNTRHTNSNPASRQIDVVGFNKMVLRGIDIEINQGSSTDPSTQAITIFAFGDPGDTLKNDDPVIDGVVARYLPLPVTYTARTVVLHANAYSSSGHEPRIKIRNIDSNGTAVFTGGVTPTNPNLIIE